jgi:hypothetical protein
MPYDTVVIASKLTANGLTAVVPPTDSMYPNSPISTNYFQTRDLGVDTFITSVALVGEGAAGAGVSILSAGFLSSQPGFDSIVREFPGPLCGPSRFRSLALDPAVDPAIPLGRQGVFQFQIDNGNTAGWTGGAVIDISYGDKGGDWWEGLPDSKNLLRLPLTAEDAISGALTWDVNAATPSAASLKPNAMYRFLGACIRSADIFCWRAIPPGNVGGNAYRPGCAGTARLLSDDFDGRNIFLKPGGRFPFRGAQPPTIEIFAGSASTPVGHIIVEEL